jgi:hypothetical protein
LDIHLIYTSLFLFFLLWFAICFLYATQPKATGSFGRLLHRYGWIRQWAMYTKQFNNDSFNKVFLADVSEKNETLDWREVEDNLHSISKLLYYPNFRMDFFISKCLRKITARRRNQLGNEVDVEVFQYLCAVLAEYPKESNYNYRKVKIMRYENNEEPEVIIISDFIALS